MSYSKLTTPACAVKRVYWLPIAMSLEGGRASDVGPLRLLPRVSDPLALASSRRQTCSIPHPSVPPGHDTDASRHASHCCLTHTVG